MTIVEYYGLDDIINQLNNLNGKECLVILSERLFPSYIDKIKNLKNMNTIPLSVVLTSYIKDLEENDNYSKYIGHKIYNPLGVVESFKELKQKIIRTIINSQKKYINFEFEYIYDKKQVFLPEIYDDIVNNKQVNSKSIEEFNNDLLENYGKEFEKLLSPYKSKKNIAIEEIAKIYAKIYTMETPFHKKLNESLKKLDYEEYENYIKILYFGLKRYSFNNSKTLYGERNLSKEELNKLEEFFKEKSNKKEEAIIYTHSFKSFFPDKNTAMNFANKESIFFNLDYDKDIINKSNADLTDISYFPGEKEILFFPFSSFLIKEIKKENGRFIIDLKYLGIYQNN